MASDSQLDLENELDADSVRLEQLQLEAKAARLEAEAKALQAKIDARKRTSKSAAPPPKPAAPARATVAPSKPKANGFAAKPSAAATEKPKVAEKPHKPNKPVAAKKSPKPEATSSQSESPPAKQPSAAQVEPTLRKPQAKKPTKEKVVALPSHSTNKQQDSVPIDSTATSPAEAQGEEPLEENSGRGFVSRMLVRTPSYLISAIFHLVTLIILAMIMLPPPQDMVKQLVIDASAVEEQEDELEEVVIDSLEQELEQIELEEPVMSQAVEVADPGAADLGAVAQDVQAQVSDFKVAMNDTNIDSIGALFGNDGEGMADTMQGAGGAEFFGVKASGRRFVFIVDSSLSMKKGKFEAACEELMYAISRLSKEQYFYVLFFDHDAAKMTFDGNREPEKRAVPATGANINKLGRWVSSVELELKTNPYDCVEFALSLYPDAIYILTDGKFTDKGRTVKYLKKENLYEDPIDGTKPKTVIHTVGFYQRDGETTLKPLAKLHGGTYRFVPPPKKR